MRNGRNEGEMNETPGGMSQQEHLAVMPGEATALLAPRPAGTYVDTTTGLLGHAEKILEAMKGDGILVAIDRDPEMVAQAKKRAEEKGLPGHCIKWCIGSFADLAAHLARLNIRQVDGVLFDLGLNSAQLTAERGFSFMSDGPLDMRFSREEPIPTLAERLRRISEKELEDVLRLADERWARRIARAIIRRRDREPIETTGQLAAVIRSAVPPVKGWRRIDAATRAFMAFRMMVNDELPQLERGLNQAVEALAVGGCVVVLSFHSGEDRIVKQTFRAYSKRWQGDRAAVREGAPVLDILTPKPLRPGEEECRTNPRARSARLRAAQRVA